MALQKESDKRGGQVTSLQAELERMQAAVRDTQDKMRRAQAQTVPRLTEDAAKLAQYAQVGCRQAGV